MKPKASDSGIMRLGARDRVLEAARQMIESQGFKSASLSDILATAGVSSSNFYYHFKSKEDLGLAVLRELTTRLEDRIIQGILLDRERTPLARLKAYLDYHRDKLQLHGCNAGCPIGKLTAELSDTYPCFREEIERAFARLRESLQTCIREGVEQGEVRRGVDPHDASSLVLGVIQGLLLVSRSERNPAVFQQGASELLRLLEDRPVP